MGLEAFGFIDDLVDTNPLGTDPVSEGDNHLRGIKESLQGNVGGDATETRLLANSDVVLLADHDVGTQTQWNAAILNDVLALLGSIAAVGDTVLATFDPAGAARLMFADVARLETAADGADVLGQKLDIRDGSDVTLVLRLINTVGGVRLIMEDTTDGGGSILGQLDATGVIEQDWIQMFRDAGVTLLFGGSARLATTSAGWDSTGTIFDLGQQTNNSILLRITNSIGGSRFIISSTSGDLGINQLDNAGVFEQTWVNMARDAGVILRHANDAKLSTTVQGISVNGTAAEVISGTGTPQGSVTAVVGSLFMRTDGGASTTLYVKETGAGNTGWVAK